MTEEYGYPRTVSKINRRRRGLSEKLNKAVNGRDDATVEFTPHNTLRTHYKMRKKCNPGLRFGLRYRQIGLGPGIRRDHCPLVEGSFFRA